MASTDAYPWLQRLHPDGTRRALVERNIDTATARALALGAFCARHGSVFESDTPAPVCESHFDDHDRELRATAPYEALADFDLQEDRDSDVGAARGSASEPAIELDGPRSRWSCRPRGRPQVARGPSWPRARMIVSLTSWRDFPHTPHVTHVKDMRHALSTQGSCGQ